MSDGEKIQASWIAYLKSKPSVVSLLNNSLQIKETSWQGDTFTYPAVRVHIDYMPSVNGCGPDDIDVFIDVFSEQKSSKEAAHIAAVLQGILHKHPFTSLGVNFPLVWVKKVDKPFRDIYAWKSVVHIKGLAV
jgi:hypothetical protein